MKFNLLLLIALFASINLFAQHTFSIVAVDSISGEIGSAGATCLGGEDGALYVSDIVLNVGAINTQAFWTTVNQNAARQRMEAGDSPQEIIDWLISNDNPNEGGNSTERQYGIVDLNNGNPRSAAFTGINNFNVKGQRTGPGYSIQGNILISEDVLNDMETAFLNTDAPLSEKLMASLQAAKRPGADARCLTSGISSASAYLRVAKPTDTNANYGNLWLDLNVWLNSGEFSGDPIDELQIKFNEFKEIVGTEDELYQRTHIYPNPTRGKISINSYDNIISKIQMFDVLGNLINTATFENQNSSKILDLTGHRNGIYTMRIFYNDDFFSTHRVMYLNE